MCIEVRLSFTLLNGDRRTSYTISSIEEALLRISICEVCTLIFDMAGIEEGGGIQIFILAVVSEGSD